MQTTHTDSRRIWKFEYTQNKWKDWISDKNFHTKKYPELDGLSGAFYQTFKEKVTTIHKLFQIKEGEDVLPNLFMRLLLFWYIIRNEN